MLGSREPRVNSCWFGSELGIRPIAADMVGQSALPFTIVLLDLTLSPIRVYLNRDKHDEKNSGAERAPGKKRWQREGNPLEAESWVGAQMEWMGNIRAYCMCDERELHIALFLRLFTAVVQSAELGNGQDVDRADACPSSLLSSPATNVLTAKHIWGIRSPRPIFSLRVISLLALFPGKDDLKLLAGPHASFQIGIMDYGNGSETGLSRAADSAILWRHRHVPEVSH
ncbi:hypothetical protein NDU88_001240 [Pleurodeles waltl]|uniref:Uncharacterized protein n=1 Tax=Pleurodeles waltl TaxID=8319 RepID=A0AAV7KP21_PLEWA|nr:hypothetical protein NDU88_001240 [Pleurodeles waltl]